MSKYGAVLFDTGGTLFEYVRPFEAIWAERLSERGLAAKPDEIIRAFTESKEQVVGTKEQASKDIEEYHRIWMRICLGALERLGYVGDHREAAEAMWHALVVEKSRPYADVIPTLDTMRNHGLKMGVVSNYNLTLEIALRAHGLAEYFQAIVPSLLVGFEKPDPRIFEYAVNLLGVGSDQALYVGDTYEKDVVGARAGGLDAILITRTGSSPHEGVVAIGGLADLVPLL